jgi:hypothetical protein
MQLQLCGTYDLIEHAKFWQTKQGFDTIDIHEQGSSFWVDRFPAFCEKSCACQLPSKLPIINLIFWPQTWRRAISYLVGVGQLTATGFLFRLQNRNPFKLKALKASILG